MRPRPSPHTLALLSTRYFTLYTLVYWRVIVCCKFHSTVTRYLMPHFSWTIFSLPTRLSPPGSFIYGSNSSQEFSHLSSFATKNNLLSFKPLSFTWTQLSSSLKSSQSFWVKRYMHNIYVNCLKNAWKKNLILTRNSAAETEWKILTFFN